MVLTIGAWTYSGNAYTAQPFGYDESEVRAGRTARKVSVTALLTPVEWAGLLTVYDNWRDLRIKDPPTKTANDAGTTVNVSMAANGITWAAVPCWFSSAPRGDQVGYYIQASVELVDALQAINVVESEALADKARYHFGTYKLGATELKLLKPPESYQDAPSMALTAGGHSYITGPLTATRVKQIEGDTDQAGWAAIQAWYEDEVKKTPNRDDWWPITPPSASAEAHIDAGVRTDVYTVTISLGQAK